MEQLEVNVRAGCKSFMEGWTTASAVLQEQVDALAMDTTCTCKRVCDKSQLIVPVVVREDEVAYGYADSTAQAAGNPSPFSPRNSMKQVTAPIPRSHTPAGAMPLVEPPAPTPARTMPPLTSGYARSQLPLESFGETSAPTPSPAPRPSFTSAPTETMPPLAAADTIPLPQNHHFSYYAEHQPCLRPPTSVATTNISTAVRAAPWDKWMNQGKQSTSASQTGSSLISKGGADTSPAATALQNLHPSTSSTASPWQEAATSSPPPGAAPPLQVPMNELPSYMQQPAFATPPLPLGWEQAKDPTSGKAYFCNRTTGESSWTTPVAAAPVMIPECTSAVSQCLREDQIEQSRAALRDVFSAAPPMRVPVNELPSYMQQPAVSESASTNETSTPGYAGAVPAFVPPSLAPVQEAATFGASWLAPVQEAAASWLAAATPPTQGAASKPSEPQLQGSSPDPAAASSAPTSEAQSFAEAPTRSTADARPAAKPITEASAVGMGGLAPKARRGTPDDRKSALSMSTPMSSSAASALSGLSAKAKPRTADDRKSALAMSTPMTSSAAQAMGGLAPKARTADASARTADDRKSALSMSTPMTSSAASALAGLGTVKAKRSGSAERSSHGSVVPGANTDAPRGDDSNIGSNTVSAASAPKLAKPRSGSRPKGLDSKSVISGLGNSNSAASLLLGPMMQGQPKKRSARPQGGDVASVL